jgi:hypothetical protein
MGRMFIGSLRYCRCFRKYSARVPPSTTRVRKWTQHVPSKDQLASSRLHGVTFQVTVIPVISEGTLDLGLYILKLFVV